MASYIVVAQLILGWTMIMRAKWKLFKSNRWPKNDCMKAIFDKENAPDLSYIGEIHFVRLNDKWCLSDVLCCLNNDNILTRRAQRWERLFQRETEEIYQRLVIEKYLLEGDDDRN